LKVTGYKLREGIRVWELRKTAATNGFTQSIVSFADEDHGDPLLFFKEVEVCERNIALLQTAQSLFNLQVQVKVEGLSSGSLAEAVKLIGGAGRLEKLWRTVIKGKRDHYSTYRSAGEVAAVQKVHNQVVLSKATSAAKFAGKLRSAIAEANNNEIEVPFLTEEHFPKEE
jgi:hypothetical protein